MAAKTYATFDQLIALHDSRAIEELVSDTGFSSEISSDHPVIAETGKAASGEVERSALIGGRYSRDDLEELSDDGDWTLIGLVIDLWIVSLYERRGGQTPSSISDLQSRSKTTLQQLREGHAVFRNASNIAAGRGKITAMSLADRNRLHMASDQAIFPDRLTDRDLP